MVSPVSFAHHLAHVCGYMLINGCRKPHTRRGTCQKLARMQFIFHAGYAQEASGIRTAYVTVDDSGTVTVTAG